MHRTLRVLAVFAAMAVIASRAFAAEGKRPVTFDDLDGGRSGESVVLVTLDVSADGQRLAVERGRTLRVFDAKTGRVLQELGEGLLPAWSPGGDLLAFCSIRSGAMQLWTWDAKRGRTRQLTNLSGGIDPDPVTRIMENVGDAFRFDWSPDGTRIVFASRVTLPSPRRREAGAPLVLDNTTTSDLTLSGVFAQPGGGTGGIPQARDGRRIDFRVAKPDEVLVNRLFVADVKTHKARQIASGAGTFFHPAWSADGRYVAFAAVGMGVPDENSDPESIDVFTATKGEIGLLDVATGRQRILVGGDGIKHRPRWPKEGAEIAYLVSGKITDHPTIRVAEIFGGRTLREHKVYQHISNYDWASDADGFLLPYSDSGSKLGRLRSGDGAIAPVLPGVAGVWAQAQDGLIVWAAGPDVWVLPAGATEPVKLLNLPPSVDALKLGRIETVAWCTQRGDALEGKLLYPPDYVPGREYPVIVDAYPLTSGGLWMHPLYGNQAWAAAGYLVFKPTRARAPHVWVNCSGEPEFCRASKGPDAWDVMVDDVMSGVDELIRRGLVDPERMCLYGHSNGGGVVNYLVTQTDRFKCAVSVAPVWPNWLGAPLLGTGMWNTMSDWTGVNPLEDAAAYIKLSAVFHANEVKTPMLLAVGDKDGGFLLGAIEMYNALRFAGAEVTLLRYPDQGHLFAGLAMKDFWEREMAFFDKYLKPSPQD